MDQSGGLYAKLEERILARDQIGASAVYYDLVRAERPRAEIVGETVRIHAPYTHVPYHQRIDDGFVRFVNNDHCLLSARTSLRLPKLLPPALEYLPLAQTIWYVPTGLDPWNQLLGKRCQATTAAAARSVIPTSRSRRRSGTGRINSHSYSTARSRSASTTG